MTAAGSFGVVQPGSEVRASLGISRLEQRRSVRRDPPELRLLGDWACLELIDHVRSVDAEPQSGVNRGARSGQIRDESRGPAGVIGRNRRARHDLGWSPQG